MFSCSKIYRRSDGLKQRRALHRAKHIDEIRETAQKNRDLAYERKWGKETNQTRCCFTQEDYLRRYFAVI